MSEQTLIQRAIPSTGELLPVVGCGTWQTFDVGSTAVKLAGPMAILDTMFMAGGTVIDSSPMYGRAEEVIGTVLTAGFDARQPVFLATKVWTTGREAGIRQMARSFRLLGTDKVDLMQIHNLVDWRTHLPLLREWKASGRIRYIGITHYTSSAHEALEEVMRSEPLDFVQLNYDLDDRAAENRLLPAAKDLGVAVIVNRPFGEGSLIQKLRGKALPEVAGELECHDWAQLALKYVVSHPAVTCVIPATSSIAHMKDNLGAGSGEVPTLEQRARILEAFGS